ncbi:MAG: DUF3891 family protein [Oculatellaceae cyanobacterium bins.114]|nr:DUF3891 family protein [Oculatellaceae cyanobacterium bins.114]
MGDILSVIVHLTDSGWQVIYHRAHALLAAQLAGHWQRSNAPLRLYETLAAISHHDDLEREWEGDHLTEAGAPLDFTVTTRSPDVNSSIPVLSDLVTGARYRGRWVAMLVSMHIYFLNQDKHGTTPEWDQFLNEQIQYQEEWRKGLGIEKDEAERAYQFMRWCDRLSLILSQNQLPDAQRALEITSGIDGQRYDVRQLEDEKVTVEPWPFEEEQFTVNVEACHLSDLKFESNEALTKALQEAPIQVVEWTFVKQ